MSIGKTNVGIADLLRNKRIKEFKSKITSLACYLRLANKTKGHFYANKVNTTLNFKCSPLLGGYYG